KEALQISGVIVLDDTSKLRQVSKERTVFTEEALLIEAASQTVSQAISEEVQPTALVVGVDGIIEGWQEAFFKRVVVDGPLGASPLEFPFTSPNALAARLSIRFGIRGESLTITSGPLSFLKAIIYASELVRAGIAKVVLVGGVASGKVMTMLVGSLLGELGIEEFGEQGKATHILRSIEESFDAFITALGKTRQCELSKRPRFSFGDSSGNSVHFRFSEASQ
ncbi:MAG: hypothetical protein GY721_07270, partial [Deltaproteobacteria bacterium]|nr:hypothetical protein [Deltaproteobacteria bacterium]